MITEKEKTLPGDVSHETRIIRIFKDDPNIDRAAGLYDEYMGERYSPDRKDQWALWEHGHYRKIKEVIQETLINEEDRRKEGVEIVGGTWDDLEDGCIPLNYRGKNKNSDTENNPSILELFSDTEDLLFTNISPTALQGVDDYLKHYSLSQQGDPLNTTFIQYDVSRGISASLCGLIDEISHSNQQDVGTIIGSIRDTMMSAVRMKHAIQGGLTNTEKNLPEVGLGFSLMVQTATLLPLQKQIEKRLYQQAKKEEWDDEEIANGRADIFSLIKEYNDQIMPLVVDNWFTKNPDGKLVLFTDISTREVDTNGHPLLDCNRNLNCINPSFGKKLSRQGYRTQNLNSWFWLDEPEGSKYEPAHGHDVVAVEITREDS